jgi:hypothetical protein
MSLLASPIVDWTAMWKIVVAVLVAGAGVVVLFGLMLLGLKFSQGKPTQGPGAAGTQGAGADGGKSAATDGSKSAGTADAPSGGARLGGFTLALVCGLLCLGIIAVGVYAMTQKPSSKPAPPTKSALVSPAGSRVRLIASSR